MTSVKRGRLVLLCALGATSLAVARSHAQPARWALDARPSLTLGLDDQSPAALLQFVVSATRLPDGSILVGDRGEYALKLFAPGGEFQRAFARAGAGPGEVRHLARMHRCGDSVYTYDIGEGHRVSVFTLAGRYVRTFRFRVPPGQQAPYRSACNAAGDFIHHGWGAFSEAKPGVHRPVAPVWIGDADSSAIRMADSVPGSERWGIGRGGRVTTSRPLPLGKEPVIGIGRSRAYVGTADQYVVRVLDLNGRTVGALRRAESPAAVSRADIRDVIEHAVAVSPAGEARRARIEQEYAEIEFPATLPAYTHLVVDAADQVWVRGFPGSAAGTALWSVFAPSGALLAEVAVPKHLEVFEIGRDYLLGRYLDPDEAIPQVRLYRLSRGTGR